MGSTTARHRQRSLAPALAAPEPARARPAKHEPEAVRTAPGGELAYTLALGVRPRLAGVSPVDHPHEHEADRVATEITGHPPAVPTVPHAPAAAGSAMPALGVGSRLPADSRAHWEFRLGHDLGRVRLHTDDRADAAARGVGALAFTRGDDIAFREGAYAPTSPAGQHLLAHELTHVVQAQGRPGPWLYRVPGPPPPPAVRLSRDQLLGNVGLGIVGKTLEGFQAYTDGQADWFVEPTLAAVDRAFLWQMLLLIQATEIRSGIGDIQLSDLRALAAADWPKLQAFCRGTDSSKQTVRLFPPRPPLADRISIGDTLLRLEAIIPADQLRVTVSQSQLLALRADPALLVVLADYWARFEPFLEQTFAPTPAGSGPEFTRVLAFLNAIKVTGIAPLLPLQGGSPALRWVRNLHRFPLAMLQQLVTNLGETGGSRPFVLVLHSGHDAPGAFQGAAGLFADLVANTGRISMLGVYFGGPNNLVLMIEGARTLAEITARIPGITATYGQIVGGVRRISQVVIAGHGSPTSVSLAGFSAPNVVGNDVRYTEESVIANDPTSRILLDALMTRLDPATARVLYVGCLVAARQVPAGTPAAGIPAAFAASSSLAGFTETRAVAAGLPITPGVTVQGARASVGIGGVTSLKDPSGNLAPTYPDDPKAFGPATAYVPSGAEPEGVLRAAVEVGAVLGPGLAEALLRTRLMMPAKPGDWYDIMTRLMVTVALPVGAAPFDLRNVNEAANVADIPFLVLWPRFHWINAARYVTHLNPQPFAPTVYAGLGGTTQYTAPADDDQKRLRVIVDQGWFRLTGVAPNLLAGITVAGLRADLLAAHLDVTATVLGGHEGALLPIVPGPTVQAIRLALAWYQLARATPHVRAFLAAQVTTPAGVPPSFTPAVAAELTAAGMDDRSLLRDLGFPVVPLAAGGAPAPNVQVPGSAANTVYVEPRPRHTTVKASVLNVRERPGGPILGALKAGDPVDVAGVKGSWSAIDWNGKLGFVWTAYLNP